MFWYVNFQQGRYHDIVCMSQNNLKYSFNGFSDNCQVYANVGNVSNVSGHKNRDIQS
jgi:hypothetical protein